MSKVEELLKLKHTDILRKKKEGPVPSPTAFRIVHWDKRIFRIFAEVKRASLSAGNIRNEANIQEIAASYQSAGVSMISVLTEERFFHGSIRDLEDVRTVAQIPVLQKDFILDEFQILQAGASGADFILLIARFLTAEKLESLYRFCTKCGLNAIVEITELSDLEKVKFPVPYLGVNSRNLETLEIQFEKFALLRNALPSDSFLIAESGISTLEMLKEVIDLGYNAALIGEHFLRQPDPGKEADNFVAFASSKYHPPKIKICGITNRKDAEMAIDAGANALGFIFAESPRAIALEEFGTFRAVIPPDVLTVGVFRGQAAEAIMALKQRFRLDVIQTYEPVDLPGPVWQARAIRDSAEIRSLTSGNILWDVKTENGERQKIWFLLDRNPVFALAGALHADNVSAAITSCHPEWIDVARGVEERPGIKSEEKLRRFIHTVRGL